MGGLPMCVSVYHLHNRCLKRLKMGLKSGQLEIQTPVSFQVGTGSQTNVLWKNSQCS